MSTTALPSRAVPGLYWIAGLAAVAAILVGLVGLVAAGPVGAWIGATLLTAAATFAGLVGLVEPLRRLAARREQESQQALTELYVLDLTPRQLTYLMVAASVIAGVIFLLLALHAQASVWGTVLAVLVGVFLGNWVPRLVVFVLRRRRRRKLNDQLIDGLVTLANGMRAGLNLVQTMKLIETNAQPPISQEFALMLREFDHGTSVDEVLRRASARIKIHHYKLLFAAMQTARVRGGNLPDTLDRLREALREIVRLEEKVRAVTAENRMSAVYMALMSIVMLGIYYVIEPEFLQTLLGDQWGLLLLAVAVVLDIVAFIWLRKIVTFEI